MMLPCRVCGELVMGRPVQGVGEERGALELTALAAAARQHIAYRHKQLVGAFNLVLQPAADYLALNGLVSDVPVLLEVRGKLFDDAHAALKFAELVKRVERATAPPNSGPAPPDALLAAVLVLLLLRMARSVQTWHDRAGCRGFLAGNTL